MLRSVACIPVVIVFVAMALVLLRAAVRERNNRLAFAFGSAVFIGYAVTALYLGFGERWQ